MTDQEYLNAILEGQDLGDDSDELKALLANRKDVEAVLRDRFPDCAPTICYGGSIAKGTLVKKAYDLDLICYFPNDDTTCGETLKDIYKNTKSALGKKYPVEEKTSAIRLRSTAEDFHIDVVPGRYTDETKTDTYLYQAGAEKERLKTNLQVHIDYIKNSGVIPAIRLMKLWRTTYALAIVKTFGLELLTIKILAKNKRDDLSAQMSRVLTTLKDDIENITIEDPANPTGNDLCTLLNDDVRHQLSTAARATLLAVERQGWQEVFGPLNSTSKDDRKESLHRAAAVITSPTKPWLP